MSIKHLTGRTNEELILVLKNENVHKNLIKACKENEKVLKQIVEFLNIPPDLTLTPEQTIARNASKVESLNNLYKALKEVLVTKRKNKYKVKVKIGK